MDLARIIQRMTDKGYVVFCDERSNYDLNLVGIRNEYARPNAFDDVMWVFWKWHGTWHERQYRITTDPGLAHFMAPHKSIRHGYSKARPVPAESWLLEKHKGVYEALVQRQLVTVIRDHNRDGILDFHSGREQTDFFGINIHREANRAT